MKKILILGVTGLLGSNLAYFLSRNIKLNVVGTYFKKKPIRFESVSYRKFDCQNISEFKLKKFISEFDIVINCILQKNIPKKNNKCMFDYFSINTLLPITLSKISKKIKTKVIHISTDIFYNKKKRNSNSVNEEYIDGLYAISKIASESSESKNFLSIRTSFIGIDIYNIKGQDTLFNYAINEEKKIVGYSNLMWSGITTYQISEFIENVILENRYDQIRKKNHVINLGSNKPISKYLLLKKICELYNTKVKVIKDGNIRIDRSFKNTPRIFMGLRLSTLTKSIKELKIVYEKYKK